MNRRRLIALPIAACALALMTSTGLAAQPSARHFANCTAMHKVYPHGVGMVSAHDHVSGHGQPVTNFKRSNALYLANKGSDRDHDKIACEAH